MKPMLERAEEALAEIQPILKKHFVDMGAEPYIDVAAGGVMRAKVVWFNTAPKADEMPAEAPLLEAVTEGK